MNMTNGNGFGVSSTTVNSSGTGGGNGQKRRTVIEQLNQGYQQQNGKNPNANNSNDDNGEYSLFYISRPFIFRIFAQIKMVQQQERIQRAPT